MASVGRIWGAGGSWGVLVPCEKGFQSACRLEMLIIVTIGGDQLGMVLYELYSCSWSGWDLPLIMSAHYVSYPAAG